MHATESLMLNAITLFHIGWQECVRRYIIDIRALLYKNFSISSYLENFRLLEMQKVIRSANLQVITIVLERRCSVVTFENSLFRCEIWKCILNLKRYYIMLDNIIHICMCMCLSGIRWIIKFLKCDSFLLIEWRKKIFRRYNGFSDVKSYQIGTIYLIIEED